MMQETLGKHVKYVTGECMLFVPIRKEDNDNFDNCNAKDGRTTPTKIQKKKTKKLLDLLNVRTLKRTKELKGTFLPKHSPIFKFGRHFETLRALLITTLTTPPS